MAVRLLTWLDRGRDQLDDLLVVCGLPQAQAKLAYSARLCRTLHNADWICLSRKELKPRIYSRACSWMSSSCALFWGHRQPQSSVCQMLWQTNFTGMSPCAANMAPKFRRVVASKLATHAPMFGLSEVAFPSFELQHGWNRVRASHLKYLILRSAGLLQCCGFCSCAFGRAGGPFSVHAMGRS